MSIFKFAGIHTRLSARILPALLMLTVVSAVCFAQTKSTARISPAIDNAQLTQLRENVSPMACPEFDHGRADGSMKMEGMKLIFSPTAAQQAALDTLLAQQQDRSSPNYHRWLTPEQFADRFGLGRTDLSTAANWLESQGFTVTDLARGRNYIAFSGTATQVEEAFHTQIHHYVVNGQTHYANATEPSIPSALAVVVTAVGSLHNFAPKPRLVRPNPRVTSTQTGKHFVAPGDYYTIYDINPLFNTGIDGTGQSIAVMGQTDLYNCTLPGFTNTPCPAADVVANADIITFRSLAGLSAPNIQVQLVTTDPGLSTSDVDEANLDIEWAGAIAKNAKIIYVIGNPNTGGGAFDALVYAVNKNLAPVISISYGLCEPQIDSSTQTLVTNATNQAAAQGQTVVAPAGDSGAADCDTGSSATHGLAVDFPGSIPTVTSMGGSEFTGDSASLTTTQYWTGATNDTSPSAISYIPEMVWNDTVADGTLAAGGGGISILYGVPAWQATLTLPNNDQGKPGRATPDISLNASADHDGLLICSQGLCQCSQATLNAPCVAPGWRSQSNPPSFTVVGGTSAGVPTFAGVVALIVQKQNEAQGNINPVLYGLAGNTSTYAAAFHDITTGNNIVPCTIGTKDCPSSSGGQIGYSAGTGYDVASGWGSVDVSALVAAWDGASNPDFSLAASSSSLTIGSGGTGTDTITATAIGGFSGTINLSCSVAGLSTTTCSLSPASLTGSGTSTLTINAATLTSRLDRPSSLSPRGLGVESSFLFAAVLLVPRRDPSRTARQKRLFSRSLLGLLVMSIVLSTTSCGGGSSSKAPPTPLNGTVTVTGTSAALTHSVQIAVTIN
ncbi:MAG TPA: S53 family peptidase [Terriglobales bacterium]|nr:S53 family peptidase [Terriglobales bacterium]